MCKAWSARRPVNLAVSPVDIRGIYHIGVRIIEEFNLFPFAEERGAVRAETALRLQVAALIGQIALAIEGIDGQQQGSRPKGKSDSGR